MNQRRYRGRLNYDGINDYLEIESFIVRGTEIAYSLVSVSHVHGRWIAESGKPALLQSNGRFIATDVWASKLGVKSTSPWLIEFQIESEEIGNSIEISGQTEEAGSVMLFYGELTAVK